MMPEEVGERLVTVLLTLVVPEVADPEDAAALVADAASTRALEVRHAVGVEGHLPAPGATVVRPGRWQPWPVVAVTADTLRLRDLTGDVVEVSRRGVQPVGRRPLLRIAVPELPLRAGQPGRRGEGHLRHDGPVVRPDLRGDRYRRRPAARGQRR